MSARTEPSQLDDRSIKLFLLALDPAAAPGEIKNAAIALVRSLRQRYADGHAFLAGLTDKPEPPRRPAPDAVSVYGAVRMPFGKYRERQLRDIPPGYLMWVLDNCDNLDPYLHCAIRRYLQ
jgi:hypothetical protein